MRYAQHPFGSGAYSGGENPIAEISRYGGAFDCRLKRRLSNFQDGLSNSVLAGESLGQISDGNRESSHSWMFAAMARGRSDFSWKSTHPIRNPGLELFGDDWYSSYVGFGSTHPTIVTVALGDGSTQSITREIELQMWYALCGIADGELASLGFD